MINRVVLVGRLTKEVNLRKTGTGTSVASFTVACNRRFVQGQGQEQTADFINCVAWRQSADFLAQYAKKGVLLGVEGRINTRSYDDSYGKRVYVTEVVADSVQILESKKQDNQGTNASTPAQTSSEPEPNYEYDFGYNPPLDLNSDDLPF